MGKTKDLGHLAHIVAYDAENHITVPAGITMHTNQLVASQAYVTTALSSYALSSALGSYVPTSRTITINGTTFDLSANREWNITSMIYPAAGIALSTGSAWGTSITNNSANWNTAYGWGNHATAGYVPQTRTITINGVALDLTENRSWTIAASSGVTSFNTRTGAVTLSSGDVTAALGYTPYNSSNPSGYITAITSTMVTSALGYTPYNSTNPSGYISVGSNISNGFGLADQKLYLRTFGDNNHFLWNADDDWEEMRYYGGTGFRIQSSTVGATATFTNSGFTSNGFVRVSANNNLYLDYNHGQSIVGVYSSVRYQGVFSMGDAYKLPIDGTSPGNLYGMTWSHPNAGGVAGNLNTHGLLILENGSFLAAISGSIRARDDMRAPIFYDSNDTAFYLNPAGSSRLRNLYVGDSGSDWSDPGGWGTQFHVSNGPHSIIRVYARNESIQTGMYSHVGGLSKAGSLSNHDFRIIRNDSDRMIFYSGYTYSNGYLEAADSLRAPIFYDSNNTSYYLDPNGTSQLHYVMANNWFRAQGDSGFYSQDYGGHMRRTVNAAHGTWEIFGYNKAGYAGMNIQDPQGYYNNYMHESGSGGLYSQNYRGDWIWYHNAGQNCTSFNGSATDGGVRFRVNGSMRVTSDFNPQGYTGFGGNVEWPIGYTQYHGTNTAYNWRDWGGWGGYWWSRNGGDMIMNLYALYSVTGSISDMRYKKDVVALPYGLNELMQLNPIKYHYDLPKESMLSNDPDYFLGFSAQEVQGIIPEAVHEKIAEDSESMQGMLAITMNELIPVTVQAIKEQQVMIHNQGIRIQKLEALVNQLLNN
jgi:hypothetical protein